MRDAISSCNLVRIGAEVMPVQFFQMQSWGWQLMSSLSDLDKLIDLLIRAQALSASTKNHQVKLLIELAMFELGKSIAQQSLGDLSEKIAKSS